MYSVLPLATCRGCMHCHHRQATCGCCMHCYHRPPADGVCIATCRGCQGASTALVVKVQVWSMTCKANQEWWKSRVAPWEERVGTTVVLASARSGLCLQRWDFIPSRNRKSDEGSCKLWLYRFLMKMPVARAFSEQHYSLVLARPPQAPTDGDYFMQAVTLLVACKSRL